MKKLIVCMAVACLVVGGSQNAQAQVSRPHATATPQGDPPSGRFSFPVLPTPLPGCVANTHYMFGDPVGCIYACAGTARRLVVAGGAACAYPTGALTATPTATVTPTPTATPTATLTPTPTVTSTP